jgi:hypothetical protein
MEKRRLNHPSTPLRASSTGGDTECTERGGMREERRSAVGCQRSAVRLRSASYGATGGPRMRFAATRGRATGKAGRGSGKMQVRGGGSAGSHRLTRMVADRGGGAFGVRRSAVGRRKAAISDQRSAFGQIGRNGRIGRQRRNGGVLGVPTNDWRRTDRPQWPRRSAALRGGGSAGDRRQETATGRDTFGRLSAGACATETTEILRRRAGCPPYKVRRG